MRHISFIIDYVLDILSLLQINRNESILPNVTLGAVIRDDCYSGTIALEESLNFVLNAFGQEVNICTDSEDRPAPIMGVVGTVSSGTAVTVASLLRLFRLPQVSYGATSPDLSNRDEYEYFTRTVPSDDSQAKAIIDIIVRLEWSAVFVISSSGNYGERIRERFVALTQKPNTTICVVDELKIGGNPEESDMASKIELFVARMDKKRTVRGVVLLTEAQHARAVLKVVNSKKIPPGPFYWLCTDTWGVGQNLEGVEDIAKGAISVALHTPNRTSLEGFYDYFRTLKYGGNPRNPWFDDFMEEYMKCNSSDNSTGTSCNSYDHEIWKDDKVPYVFDSVYALAYSLDAMLRTTNASLSVKERLEELSNRGTELLGYLMNVTFVGKSGNVHFDENGNGMPRYDIMSYDGNDYNKIAVWDDGKFISSNTSWFEERKRMDNSSSYCGKECKIGEGKIDLLVYC